MVVDNLNQKIITKKEIKFMILRRMEKIAVAERHFCYIFRQIQQIDSCTSGEHVACKQECGRYGIYQGRLYKRLEPNSTLLFSLSIPNKYPTSSQQGQQLQTRKRKHQTWLFLSFHQNCSKSFYFQIVLQQLETSM